MIPQPRRCGDAGSPYPLRTVVSHPGDAAGQLSVFANNLFDKSYALTKGRDNAWSFSRAATPATLAVNWKPGRDSERYFGVRAQVKY